ILGVRRTRCSLAAEYFACLFKLGNVDYYVIWYSNGRDGLVREDGRVMTFPTLEALQAYAIRHELKVKPEETARYDWDAVERWCNEPTAAEIAVDSFLNAWNMIVDALPAHEAASLFAHADGQNGDLYRKLFRANNLPAMTPPEAEYWPVWTRTEVNALAQV